MNINATRFVLNFARIVAEGRSMKSGSVVTILFAALAAGGCSSAPNCEEPQTYEFARSGKRIQAPDGLDELASVKEMTIPEASPRAPRAPGSGCLDRPPTLRIEDDEDADDAIEDEAQTEIDEEA